MTWLNSLSVELVQIECWVSGCGIPFGISGATHRDMKERGTTIYCPHGHRIRYGESEITTLQRQLSATQAREAAALREARVATITAKAARTSLKRLKARVSHGVCPCCQRTFKQLAQHMKTKHPEYVGAQPEIAEA